MIFQKANIWLFFFIWMTGFSHSLGQSRLNIDLVSHWDSDTILHGSSNVKFSDVWGYEADGREYGLICSTQGVHVFELKSDYLQFVDFIPGTFQSAQITNRDVTTYKQYAYTGCDHGNSNLQIIDLSTLPDSAKMVKEIDLGFGRIHSLFVDEENALLYVCRVTPIVNGNPTSVIPMRVFSLADPLNPVLLYEGPNGITEVHDIWVQNNIAYLNCGFDGLRVYNFSNPSAPQFLQNLTFYQHQGYNHQGALTPNGKKYVFADETNGKPVKFAQVNDNHQIQIQHYLGVNTINNSIPHNIMCTDEFAFVAYYNEGLRIFDIQNSPREVAHYDTYSQESNFKMHGAWGVYINLPSKRILVSDIQSGLYVFDFDRDLLAKSTSESISIYPTYLRSGDELIVKLKEGIASSFEIKGYNLNGECVLTESIADQTYKKITPQLSHGVYFLEIIYTNYLKEEKRERYKFVIY